MSVSQSPHVHFDIASRLRAAGCVYAEDEARLLIASAPTSNDLVTMVEHRVAGLPLEHVLGWAEFCGLRIVVDRGVFVPRRRTEFLVQQAVTFTPPRGVAVDLCCGSGAVGAALAAAVDYIDLYAVDINPAAVQCARRNLASSGGQVYEGDLFEPLPIHLRGRVDVLVSNAPYVPTQAIKLLPPEARMHEVPVALDGGADGLDVIRRLTAEAPHRLAAGGHLLFEVSESQAPDAARTVAANGLIASVARAGDLDATVVIGTKRA